MQTDSHTLDQMLCYEEGDRVRVDIPDENDPDHERLHGAHGTVIEIQEDGAGATTGDDRDNYLVRIEVDSGETVDLRWRDLRPPIE